MNRGSRRAAHRQKLAVDDVDIVPRREPICRAQDVSSAPPDELLAHIEAHVTRGDEAARRRTATRGRRTLRSSKSNRHSSRRGHASSAQVDASEIAAIESASRRPLREAAHPLRPAWHRWAPFAGTRTLSFDKATFRHRPSRVASRAATRRSSRSGYRMAPSGRSDHPEASGTRPCTTGPVCQDLDLRAGRRQNHDGVRLSSGSRKTGETLMTMPGAGK